MPVAAIQAESRPVLYVRVAWSAASYNKICPTALFSSSAVFFVFTSCSPILRFG